VLEVLHSEEGGERKKECNKEREGWKDKREGCGCVSLLHLQLAMFLLHGFSSFSTR